MVKPESLESGGVREQLRKELRELERVGRRRGLRRITGAQGPVITLGGAQVINFSSNNYLDLAAHPTVVAAAAQALSRAGVGAGASRLVVGNENEHEALEAELAAWHEAGATRLFNSGYNANVGVLTALVGPDDVVVSDSLNHASIIDGVRLSRAKVEIYPHADVGVAAAALERHKHARRRLLVTDSVFSMDGDCAPLAELAGVAEANEAWLVIDEAHATGVLGAGRGLSAQVGVQPAVHVGTLGKALGSFGAYVAGSEELAEVLLNRARSLIFTTALPPAIVAASRAALAIAGSLEGAQRRAQLVVLQARFAAGLSGIGLLVPGAGKTPIFPVVVGDDRRVMACCEELLAAGVFAQGIRPPTVPEGTARLRFALMSSHTPEQLDLALEVLERLRRRGMLEGADGPRPGGPR